MQARKLTKINYSSNLSEERLERERFCRKFKFLKFKNSKISVLLVTEIKVDVPQCR
jgi:hypothetical protein